MKILTLVLLLPCAAGAQTSAPAAGAVSAAPVVARLAETIEENYVFPDTGRMVADHLRKRLAEGAYADVTQPAQLADRLTRDMQALNGDRHLYVSFAGGRGGPATASGAGTRVVMRRPGDPVAPEALAMARRVNHDFQQVQRLPGNVGYVSLAALRTQGSDEVYATIDAAMAFLQHADAIIIDLRRTYGGQPMVSDYLASYFFGAEPVRTLNSYSRGTNRTEERTTVAVKGTRRPDIPVFLLVGPGTASGTEDFAFIMKQTGRATLVGGRTAGAGRLTRMFPLGDGFVASVSGGRTYDPRTGNEWERTGIEPDVPASDADALTVAHVAVLQRLASAASDTVWKRTLEWTRSVVLARAKPVPIAPDVLRSYAGDYESRLVRYEDGKLWFQPAANRLREELVPVRADTFALGEATRVEFVRDGPRVTAMKFVSPLGQTSTFPLTR